MAQEPFFADADHDGELSDDEAREFFKRLDKDGSGTLTASEVEQWLDGELTYSPAAKDLVRRCIHAAAKDSNGRIDLEEFVNEIRFEREEVRGKDAQKVHQVRPFQPLGTKIDEMQHLHAKFTNVPFETRYFCPYEHSIYKNRVDLLDLEAPQKLVMALNKFRDDPETVKSVARVRFPE